MKRKIFSIAIILALVLGLNVITAAPAAAATPINVPGDYGTIQEAINAASPGDTIVVAAGTYNENIVIDKTLTLQGSGRATTTIDGSAGNPAVKISGADNVVVTGFTIIGPTGQNERQGLKLEHANDCLIEDNEILGGTALFIGWDSNRNEINNNELYSDTNTGEIYVVWLYFDAVDNALRNNSIHTGGAGILIATEPEGTIIEGNTIYDCEEGIAAYSDAEAHENKFLGFDGVSSYAIGAYPGIATVDATANWWGTAVESEIQALIECGDVFYDPWYADADMTQLTSSHPVINITQRTVHDTIQEGVTNANPGDTIEVEAGTYNEMVSLDKDGLTLRGANAGIHPVVGIHPTETAGARGPETILTHNYYAIKPQADNLTVDGFKFTGSGGRLIDTYADAEDFHLTNCIFEDPARAETQGVVQFGGGSHTGMLIDFNLFQDEGDHTLYFGGGPYDGLTITANKFNGYGDGVFWTASTLVDGVIEYNEFDGTIGIPGQGGPGLNIGAGGNIAIRNNWFHDMYGTGFQVGIIGGSVTGNYFENTYPAGSHSDAFQLWGGEWGTPISSNVTIIGNTIIFNQHSGAFDENGIRLRPGDPGDPGCNAATIRVGMNEFVNGGASPTAFAIRNQGTGTLDATLNSWGTTDGPTIAAMLDGDIDYDPWIGAPGSFDFEDFKDGESGTLSVDSTSVYVQMDGGDGSFGVVEVPGPPGAGFAGMGNGIGIGKTIVINTTAADGTYLALIQMYYGDVNLVAAGIDENDLRLYYYDTATSTWELAVEGNIGPDNDIRWIVGGAPLTPLTVADLGKHGIDTAAKVIWAVVNHNTDYSGGVGALEAWVDVGWNNQADVDTFDPTLTWHVDAFKYIQDAIDSCASGAKINVRPGTYNENLVVNKPDMTVKATGNAANTIIQPGAGVGINIQGNGDGFKLKKLTVQSGAGTTFLIQLENGPADVTIVNSVIDTTGSASQGISVGAAGATGLNITGNDFIAESGDLSIWGPEVVSVNVSGNNFTGPGPGTTSGWAVQFAGVTGTSSIADNTISGYGGGIAVANGEATSGLTVSGNTITDCAKGIGFLEYVQLGHTPGNMDDVDVTDNTLTDNDVAIYVGAGAHVLADQFLIEYNYISGSATYGLQNANALTVTAMKNWWGDNKGPNHPSNPLGCPPYGSGDAITDRVIYQPWLDNANQPDDGTDDYIDAIADANTEVFIHNFGGGHVVSAGRWSHNPDHAYPDFMVVGGYFIDVVIEDHTGFNATTWIEIRFHYDDADVDAGLIEQTFRMKWWDGSNWLDCSETGVNTAENYVWVIVRATGTSPTLTDLWGTPFSATGQRVVIPGLTLWGTLALAGLFLGAIVWTVRRKRATVNCRH